MGRAHVGGTATGINTETGERIPLVLDAEIGFMQGAFVGADGKRHRGTFGFIWVDLHTGPVDPEDPFKLQVHDFNPGIKPSGLFWTLALPARTVEADPERGTARMVVRDLKLKDEFDFPNAAKGGRSVPATVSFDLRWMGGGDAIEVSNPKEGFRGSFVQGNATLLCSAEERAFRFVSERETSTATFAAVGMERNGVFYT